MLEQKSQQKDCDGDRSMKTTFSLSGRLDTDHFILLAHKADFFETNSVIWLILLDLGSNDLKTQSAHRGLDAQASAGPVMFLLPPHVARFPRMHLGTVA